MSIVIHVRALLRFLKSVRLAMVLILVIIAVSLSATLIPQNRPDVWYAARYPRLFAEAVRVLHLSNFFRSAIFLAPVGLFTLNLGVCTFDRIIRSARSGTARRFGPDLLHAGLLVLIAGGLLTSLAREETTLSLAEGEEAVISPSYSLHLLSFQALYYENGSPREWISTVRVIHDGREADAAYPVRVNHPLRLGGLRVYQSSWDVTGALRLTDAGGIAVDPPSPGDYFQWEGVRWTFEGYERPGAARQSMEAQAARPGAARQSTEAQAARPGAARQSTEAQAARPGADWRAAFRREGDGGPAARLLFGVGDRIGPFIVGGIEARAVTGLKVVRDPGRIPFLVSLPLILAGLCLALVQKRGDRER